MKSNFLSFLDRGLRFSFYAIFFVVPLIVFSDNFELFEFNKMWTVFGFSLLVLFFWTSKIIMTGKFLIKRTPLDLPILLFLLSQIVSTIFSLDPHVSFWGYYSRFNGGLLSIISYVFLYYAFVSNMTGENNLQERDGNNNKGSNMLLFISLLAGLVVALWGLPSHYGYDPNCLLFRGELNVSCWTEAFQPKVRIFSTLGQPNWLAAYLSILLPISIVFAINKFKEKNWKIFYYLALTVLFYLDLEFTRSQSGFFGFWVGNLFFLALFIITLENRFSVRNVFKEKLFKILLGVNISFLLINFFFGFPIEKLQFFTFQNLQNKVFSSTNRTTTTPKASFESTLESNITGSGKIRLIVWKGALNIFAHNPLFGTGVETFAYAYYKNRPIEHNLTSEWDYLYNKAHNEYLNYLATTGIFGFGTYIWIIGLFLFITYKKILKNKESKNENKLISYALLGSYMSILVSNFFGFSVVIVNLYFFLIPALFFDYQGLLPEKYFFKKNKEFTNQTNTMYRKFGVFAFAFLIIYLEFLLFRFWLADRAFALGYNLDKVGEYAKSYEQLITATKLRPGEDLFKDELSLNLATLSLYLGQQGESTQAAEVAQEAKNLSDQIVSRHPNNVIFYKTRTRVMYSLNSIDPNYMKYAVESINEARRLAPTDPKIIYNAALIYNQTGNTEKAISTLKETIRLKPNYQDAYHAIILFYTQLYTKEKTINPEKAESYKSQAENYIKQSLAVNPKDGGTLELQKSLNNP